MSFLRFGFAFLMIGVVLILVVAARFVLTPTAETLVLTPGAETPVLTRAAAAIVPGADIDGLTEKSTLIALGELVTVEPNIGIGSVEVNGTPVKVRIDRGTLRVDESLRGATPSPLIFDFMVPVQNIGWRIPAQQNYGMFFLRAGDDGKTALTDPYYSYIAVPPGLHGSGETPVQRVVSILSEMLMNSNNRSHNLIALLYLEDSKSKAANAALRAALNAAREPDLQVRIAKALLLQGDPSPIRFIKEMFLTGPMVSVDDKQQEVLGNVMAYYLKDPEAIPALEELLDARSVFIRRGAAGALRRTGTPAVLNGLAKALNDTDSTVRYDAVVGLSEVTKQKEWKPTEQTFKADESKYLSHWRDWARNH